MKGTFFIASQPRSRTAWLANFFTTGSSYCYHEALKSCPTVLELQKAFEETPADYVGNSDSGLPFYIDEVMSAFPEAKLVVIERDPAEVLRSLQKAYPQTPEGLKEAVELTGQALEILKKKYHPLVVGYEELNRPETCRKLWQYCVPTLPFSEKRWKMLDLLTVEIHPEKYLKTLSLETAQRVAKKLKEFSVLLSKK